MLNPAMNREELERRAESKASLSKRQFDVICIKNCECLSMSFGDIDLLKIDFAEFLTGFVRRGI